jgi:outer membrane lipoprotein LolB
VPRPLPLAGAILVLLLTACAGQPQAPSTPGDWDEHSARMRALTSWGAEGKLALRTPTQSESANVQWQQQGDTTRLKLNGPLGVAATSLYSNGRTLVIRQGEESSTLDLADPGALRRQTGWDLPLLALPHWIKGIPAPDIEIQQMEAGPDPSLLQVLKQNDWEIRYEAYANFNGLTLPVKLLISHLDTTVRLIIRNWQVEPH